MLIFVAAGGLSVASMATVYESWRRQMALALYVGMAIWLLSAIAWSYAVGWEFGVLYALCIPGIIVWPFIIKHQTLLPRPKHVPQPRSIGFSVKSTLQNLGHYVVLLAVLLVVSVFMSLAVSTLLPFDTTGKLATSVVLLPILWGLAAYHYLASTRKLSAIIVYTVIAAISAAILIAVPI